jgi:SRSO17 transposase
VGTAAGAQRADRLAARLPRWAWQRLSAGRVANGERLHDWAWIATHPTSTDTSTDGGDVLDTQR